MGPVVRRFPSPHRASASAASAHAAHAAQGTEIHWVGPGRNGQEVVAGVASIHMAWGGAHSLCVRGHALRLDDEVFLTLNAGHVLTARGRRDPGASLLSVYFAPDLLADALADFAVSERELLSSWTQSGTLYLFEHLRERDKSIDSVMRYIAHHVCEGVDDPHWYEEQVRFLLRRALANEAAIVRTIGAVSCTKAWKRREIFLRLARVTDLIHSAYERPLTIAELAEAAHWSVFHMMREFKAVHGVSPHEFLQRRRTQAAARLLCSTELPVSEVAERVGFHDRSTLMRRLQRSHGIGARALRVLAPTFRKSPQQTPHRKPTAAASRVNSATSISPVR
ncbi:MAG: helix-turn-helix domain-containing protein [Steroidobacter sp.]